VSRRPISEGAYVAGSWPWTAVRLRLVVATKGATHFAVFTDGRKVLLEIRSNADDLLQLVSGIQWTFALLIKAPAERVGFDDASGLACRCYPRGKRGPVVLDPAMSFGRPTLVRRSVATPNIPDFYQA